MPDTQWIQSSSVLETDPVGGPLQGKFLNAVWEVKTNLLPKSLKDKLLQIELQLGRRRTVPNAPREIDLDILFYGNRIIEEESLTIPHPRLHERSFVLVPLEELTKDFVHPKLNKSIRELLHENNS